MTVRVIEHSPCCSTWSVAEKVTTYCPTWERSGVQENTLLTGLPVVGSGGVMIAPDGRPATFSVTTSPASGSDAVTVVLAGTPAGRVSSELLQAGCENTGGSFTSGTSWMKKSTATRPLSALVTGSRSSMITWVEYSVL